MGGNDVEIDSLWEKPPCDSVPTSVKSAEEAATVRSSFYAVELKWLYKMVIRCIVKFGVNAVLRANLFCVNCLTKGSILLG